MTYELAQVNYARLLAPLDSPVLRDFVAGLDPVNAAAEAASGFVWRLQSEGGDATDIAGFEWDAGGSLGVIVNMSVWTDVPPLAEFVYGELHRLFLRRRREWFEHVTDFTAACWWVPAGHRPTVAEAEERIRSLRRHGVTPEVFTLQRHFPSPDAVDSLERAGADDWLCPA